MCTNRWLCAQKIGQIAYDGAQRPSTISPLSLATHRHVPAALRQQGMHQISLDPGERYMIPERAAYIRQTAAPNRRLFTQRYGSSLTVWR